MKFISRGDLISDGHYSVHSRFNSVVNYTCNGSLLSFVSHEIGNGPVNFVVENVPLSLPDDILIRENYLSYRSESIDISDVPVYNSKCAIVHFDLETLKLNLGVIRETLVSHASELSLAFLFDPKRRSNFTSGFEKNLLLIYEGAFEKIRNGDLEAGVQKLCGLGQGLTPAGDDFICGMLLALWIMQQITENKFDDLRRNIAMIAQTENVISRSSIVQAANGHFIERVNIFAQNCCTKKIIRDDACILQILNVGESSGADMLSGFLFTFASDKIHGIQVKI